MALEGARHTVSIKCWHVSSLEVKKQMSQDLPRSPLASLVSLASLASLDSLDSFASLASPNL